MPASPVRFGGMQTPSGYLFEISGGHLALDLINTVDERPAVTAHDLLPDWDRLVDWSEQAGAVPRALARALRREGARRPEEALSVLRRVRFLRETMHGMFRAIAGGAAPKAADVAVFNDALPLALERLRLAPATEAFAWTWRHPEAALDVMLPPVVRAAADLLTDAGRLSRVRACEAADACGWLFLDLSRNRSRRWCDMSVCGNREKARRHYARSVSRSRRGRAAAR